MLCELAMLAQKKICVSEVRYMAIFFPIKDICFKDHETFSCLQRGNEKKKKSFSKLIAWRIRKKKLKKLLQNAQSFDKKVLVVM